MAKNSTTSSDPGNPDVIGQQPTAQETTRGEFMTGAPSSTQDSTGSADMTMQPTEFAELRAQAARIGLGDFHLGQFLINLVGHLGHAHGLDAATEDARLAAEARVKQREEQDASLKAAAEARTASRAAEDALPHTPEQQTAIATARAAEDARIKEDADALKKTRADEDAATKAAAQSANDTGATPAKGVSNAN